MNETPTERQLRHKAHQDMLWWHGVRKQLARDRHRDHYHRRKAIPIQLR